MEPSSSASPDAFGDVVRRHKAEIYGAALEMSGDPTRAEDLVQETFLRAFESWETFDGESAVSTWLYRITVNIYLNEERREEPELRADVDENDLAAVRGNSDNPSVETKRSVLHQRIHRALRVLTRRERTAVTLRHVSGKSTELTAEIMGVAEGTVKSLVYRAVRKLRDELGPLRDQFDEGPS